MAQAVAYDLPLKRTLAFQTNKHSPGLNALALAHDLLSRLAAAAGSAQDQTRVHKVVDQVEPMLRFCAYELALDTSRGFDALVGEQLGAEPRNLVDGYDALVDGLFSLGAEVSSSKEGRAQLAGQGDASQERTAD